MLLIAAGEVTNFALVLQELALPTPAHHTRTVVN